MALLVFGLSLSFSSCKDFEIAYDMTIQIRNDHSAGAVWIGVVDINDGNTKIYEADSSSQNDVDLIAPGEVKVLNLRLFKNNKTDNWNCRVTVNFPGRTWRDGIVSCEGEFTGNSNLLKLYVDTSPALREEK